MPTAQLQRSTFRHLILPARPSRMQFVVNHTTRRMSTTIISTILLMTFVGLLAEPEWKSKHFNYLVIDSPPYDYVFRGPNGTFTCHGSAQNVIKWLSGRLKYKFSFVLVNQTLIDKYGTHEAAFHQILNDEDIDSVASNFYLTRSRVQRFDYTTHPTWVDGFSLVVPRLGEESRLFAFIGPFEPLVWLLIFVSVIVIIAVMTLFSMIYMRYPWNSSQVEENKTDTGIGTGTLTRTAAPRNTLFNYFGSHTIYVVNIMTNQGCREAFGCYSFRVLTGIWVLCAMVLVNSYTGIVISSLTTPKTKPSIGSFEDLAASTKTKIVLRHDTAIGEQILEATSGVYKVLGDQARSNPDNIVGDPFKVAAKLETGDFAFPFLHTFAVAFVISQYKKEQQCRFKASLLRLPNGYFSMLFKKKSSYTDAHSKALVELWETGLPTFWVYKVSLATVPRADQCFVESTRRVSRIVPIQLSDLTSAFLILGIGTGLAILTFLLEVLYSRFQRYKLPVV